MKDEEIDWQVYHVMSGQDESDIKELVRRSGLDTSTVEASLRRLEKNLLIGCRDGKNKVLSINESLIRCQIRYDNSLPYTIENGVIKEKKRRDP